MPLCFLSNPELLEFANCSRSVSRATSSSSLGIPHSDLAGRLRLGPEPLLQNHCFETEQTGSKIEFLWVGFGKLFLSKEPVKSIRCSLKSATRVGCSLAESCNMDSCRLQCRESTCRGIRNRTPCQPHSRSKSKTSRLHLGACEIVKSES